MKRTSTLLAKSGHVLERVGLQVSGTEAVKETYARNRNAMGLNTKVAYSRRNDLFFGALPMGFLI